VIPTLLRASLRYLARHPWQSWLSVIGIALGVAVVVAVDVANHSARAAFQLSVERISGRATHQIEGAGGGIPEELYVRLRLEQGARPAAPVLEGTVRISGRTFTLLGLDPFAALPLLEPGSRPSALSLPDLLTRPGALLLGEADASGLGLETGSSLTLESGGREHAASVAGIIAGDDTSALEGLVIADISTAQELLDRLGTIDRIDLILDEAGASDLQEALPPGLRLVSAERRSQTLTQMTRAFHSNLTAMSLLAVLVGGFIIYNTMTFAVLRRRQLLGTLRTLGVTRGQLFGLVLAEAAGFALLGALIGIAGGVLVGWGLVQLVTRTINDIYFALTVSQLFLSPWSLIKGAGIGILVTLLSALGPAFEAAASQPRDVLRRHHIEHHGAHLLPRLTMAGVGLLAGGLILAQIPGHSIGVGFVALFMTALGFSLCVPLTLRTLGLLLAPALGRIAGPAGRLAARGITASITRTGVAAAALTVAVSATVGVGIMIDSFRNSVSAWLETTLASDLYVSAPSSFDEPGDAQLPGGIGEALARLPGVSEISKGRRVQVEAKSGPAALLALEPSAHSRSGFRFLGETAPELWARFDAGGLVLISEPYAYHQGLGTGDRLALFTASGWREFAVGGVFRDYGTDRGMLVLSRRAYAELWANPGISTLGIVLAPGVPLNDVLQRVREVAGGYDSAIRVQANRSIREHSMEVFDRTFVITRVLRLLALGVAFVGVLSALMALQLERARDYAILRATGVTRGQLLGLVLLQTSAIGLAAGLLAIPLGWLMGDLLIEVVNLRSFGWTMDTTVPGSALVLGVMLAWGAALLAGLYPALKAARSEPAAALREE
jgi:putative ABC transport system permease protein